MKNQVEKLLQRIEFLELLVLSYEETTDKLLKTNKLLLQYLQDHSPTNSSTSA